jgi:hypothetical protein
VPNRGIFLLREGKPVLMTESPHATEDLFQQMLVQFPEVLAGGTTSGDNTVRRLVLVSREMRVPGEEGGPDWFSLDHLFIDETGIPVFVEVKRATDTRIRREVVGQMLDYAANGLAYWSVDRLKASMNKSSGGSSEVALKEAFGLGSEQVEAFWRTVESNLRSATVRLVFVSDHIPDELVRIIEFLNEELAHTEVLGVDVVRYRGGDETVFVPRLVGKTGRAIAAKGQSRPKWDEPSLLAKVAGAYPPDVEAFFVKLFDHVRSRGGTMNWGRGESPGLSGVYPLAGQRQAVWSANAGVYGKTDDAPWLYIWAGEIRKIVGDERFDAFIAKLEEIPAYRSKLSEARAAGWSGKYPSCTLVLPEADRQRLLEAFDLLADAAASA